MLKTLKINGNETIRYIKIRFKLPQYINFVYHIEDILLLNN